jgi:hypothetical protein
LVPLGLPHSTLYWLGLDKCAMTEFTITALCSVFSLPWKSSVLCYPHQSLATAALLSPQFHLFQKVMELGSGRPDHQLLPKRKFKTVEQLLPAMGASLCAMVLWFPSVPACNLRTLSLSSPLTSLALLLCNGNTAVISVCFLCMVVGRSGRINLHYIL